MRIRDNRLYRATHGSFAAYCSERWSIGHRYANRLITAKDVVGNLKQSGNNCHQNQAPESESHMHKSSSLTEESPPPLPASEAQARPLSKLPPEEQPAAWQQAVETAPEGKVTAGHVEQTVHRSFLKDIRCMPPGPHASAGGSRLWLRPSIARRSGSQQGGKLRAKPGPRQGGRLNPK